MLLAAFDDDYIQALRNANDVINILIPKVMNYLIRLYGAIKQEELRALKLEVENYICNRLLPIDVLFNKLNFFSDLTNFAKKPLTPSGISLVYPGCPGYTFPDENNISVLKALYPGYPGYSAFRCK